LRNQSSFQNLNVGIIPFLWTSYFFKHQPASVSIASNKFHLYRESSGLPQTVQPLSSCKPPSKSLRFTSFSPLYLGVSKPFWRTNPWYFWSDYILHLMPYIPYMSIQCPIIKWLVLQTLQENSITTGSIHLLRFGQHYLIKTSIDSGFSYIYMYIYIYICMYICIYYIYIYVCILFIYVPMIWMILPWKSRTTLPWLDVPCQKLQGEDEGSSTTVELKLLQGLDHHSEWWSFFLSSCQKNNVTLSSLLNNAVWTSHSFLFFSEIQVVVVVVELGASAFWSRQFCWKPQT
jgi:hypothetical protein